MFEFLVFSIQDHRKTSEHHIAFEATTNRLGDSWIFGSGFRPQNAETHDWEKRHWTDFPPECLHPPLPPVRCFRSSSPNHAKSEQITRLRLDVASVNNLSQKGLHLPPNSMSPNVGSSNGDLERGDYPRYDSEAPPRTRFYTKIDCQICEHSSLEYCIPRSDFDKSGESSPPIVAGATSGHAHLMFNRSHRSYLENILLTPLQGVSSSHGD